MEQDRVEAAARDERGKNEARRLRVTGKVPAVLYGGKGEAITLSRERQAMGAICAPQQRPQHFVSGENARRQREPAMVKDWQVDPVTGNLLHVDLLRIAMDVRMRVKVPVHTFGEPCRREAAGRRVRNRDARSGNRVLAWRNSRRSSGWTSAT